VIGRVTEAGAIEAAAREIDAIGRQIAREHAVYADTGRSFWLVPLHADAARTLRPTLLALLGGSVLLLAVACANVGTLVVARAASRRTELALKVALGASRIRLARQLLAEALIVGTCGALGGLLVAFGVLDVLQALRPESLDRLSLASMTPGDAALAIAVALASSLAFSAAALSEHRALEREPNLLGTRGTSRRATPRLRTVLLAAQLAVGVVLVVCAGLLARSFYATHRADLGFSLRDALTFRLSLAPRANTLSEMNVLARSLEARLRAVPGVGSVGVISHAPFDTVPNWAIEYRAEGAPTATTRQADTRAVNPALFDVLGARLAAGRFFTENDDERSVPVVMVDQELASRTWPGQPAVGQRLIVSDVSFGSTSEKIATVIGVVEHLRLRTPTAVVREQLFLPIRQWQRDPMVYVLATDGPPEARAREVRHAVAALDPALPPYHVRSLASYRHEATADRQFVLVLTLVFAGAAVLLACVGVYGLTAYLVHTRRAELGLRVALGASPRAVLRAALANARLNDQLTGTSSHDPLAYAAGAGLLAMTTMIAALVPASRALRLAPKDVLDGR